MDLFTPFKPMEPKIATPQEVFAKEDYIYQIKWDGVRGIVHVNKDMIKVFNKKMRDKTLQYPELSGLKELNKDLILDGEIVVLKDGVPSFSSVIKRDFAVDNKKIKKLQHELPIVYCFFDIIYYEGENLTSLPWQERNKYLDGIKNLMHLEYCHFTESFTAGAKLYQAIKAKGMEGIVAKEKSSLYELGSKSGKWKKVKYRRQQFCVVCGYTVKDLRPSALLLGVYDHTDKLIYVGRAGSGLGEQVFVEFIKETKGLTIAKPPVINPPREKANYTWLEPKFTVLVEFAEWTEDLSLRSPVIKGFGQVAPKECRC